MIHIKYILYKLRMMLCFVYYLAYEMDCCDDCACILIQLAIIILKGTSGHEHPFRLHVGHDKLIHHYKQKKL